jgi:hypothetical protein
LLLPHLPQFLFFLQIEHVLKHPSKLKFMKLPFQWAIICMKRVPNKSCANFSPAMQSVQGDFRLRSAQCFFHISLYGSSKLMILDALERRFEGVSEYYFFFHCTSLNMCSNLDGNSDFPLKPCRWLTIFIAIGQELMGILHHACKINQMHILPPGWWSGVEKNCQQTKCIPKTLTCGIAYLVKKKREPNECTRV